MERLCRGTSFSAADRTGGQYLLTPVSDGEARSGGPTPADADRAGYVTADGRSAKRSGAGRYRLLAGRAGDGTELFAGAPSGP